MAILGKTAQKAGQKPRALVLVDQMQYLEVFSAALRGVAEFLPLEDPVEAIELIARFQPDILVMSIVSKKYSGLQIANMIKSSPRLAHTEIVWLHGPFVESAHLEAARRYTHNPIVRMPIQEANVRDAVNAVSRNPGFKVREKKLSYGVYVNEVLRSAENERRAENRQREAEALKDHVRSLAHFMADELKNYQE